MSLRWVERGLNRVGEVYCPGFEARGVVTQAGRMIPFLPPQDAFGLKVLLAFLGLIPESWVAALVTWVEQGKWTDWNHELQGLDLHLAPIARMLQLGLKGIAVSLYYGDPGVQKQLGFVLHVDQE